MWNGNPEFWNRHSPILFPNVGKTHGNTVLIKGTQYPTSQHGFARDSQFRCVKSAAEEAQFLFCSNEETREVYPYDFELYITYRLFVKNSCQFCAFFCDFHTKACVFQFHKTPSASFHSSTTTVHHSACQYNQKAPEKQNLFSGALFLFLCIICTALI